MYSILFSVEHSMISFSLLKSVLCCSYVAVGLILAMTSFVVVFPMIITSSLLGMTDSIHSSDVPANTYTCEEKCRSVSHHSKKIILNAEFLDRLVRSKLDTLV